MTASQRHPIGLTADQESGGEMMAKARKKPVGKPKRDEDREGRISMEIVVDCYNEGEAAMGWWSYLEDKLHVPFPARCTEERATSPLRVGDEVEVVSMGPEHECEREMFVEIPWGGKRTLAVPLAQLIGFYTTLAPSGRLGGMGSHCHRSIGASKFATCDS